jgi:G3E family GTPase
VSPPIPTSVVTGFLGAGKSTLLRRLLAAKQEQRIALIVNELGPGGTEEPVGGASTQALELPEGCVCCLRNPELIAALRELHASAEIDRIIIETTGLADPLALTWTLERPDVAEVARLDGVMTVVDVLNWMRVPEWESQVVAGDVVALAKLDLATPAQEAAARAVIRELNPAARIVAADEVPLSLLLDLPPTSRGVHVPRHSDFGHVDVVGESSYELDPLEDFLEALPPEVFRAKGQVRLSNGHWASFHVVGGRLQLDPEVPEPQHRQSRIVFFGRGLDEARLRASLAEISRG